MKKIFTLVAAAMMAVGANAQSYLISEGETFTAGQEITSVEGVKLILPKYTKDGSAEAACKTAKSKKNFADSTFVYYTDGNGANPALLTDGSWGGTTYRFEPTVNGTVTAAIVLNAEKALCLIKDNDTSNNLITSATINLPAEEGGESQTLSEDFKIETKTYGTVTFDVVSGSAYNIHCTGSKMGFYGFIFTPTTTGINEVAAEANSNVKYNLAGQKVSNSYKGLVLKNGRKYIAQ